MDHPFSAHEPVTATFTSDGWHHILRELVYCLSTVEEVAGNITRAADPRRDAWVLALLPQLQQAVAAGDRATELLHEAEARPVPGRGRRKS